MFILKKNNGNKTSGNKQRQMQVLAYEKDGNKASD